MRDPISGFHDNTPTSEDGGRYIMRDQRSGLIMAIEPEGGERKYCF